MSFRSISTISLRLIASRSSIYSRQFGGALSEVFQKKQVVWWFFEDLLSDGMDFSLDVELWKAGGSYVFDQDNLYFCDRGAKLQYYL